MIDLVRDLSLWIWWSWVASKWSGGGPGHSSYPAAKFNSWVYGSKIRSWLAGEHDYG